MISGEFDPARAERTIRAQRAEVRDLKRRLAQAEHALVDAGVRERALEGRNGELVDALRPVLACCGGGCDRSRRAGALIDAEQGA